MSVDDDAMSSPAPRLGSATDLVRRMDRIEARQDSIETEVRTLAQTVGRVEQNQEHARELNTLRFDALDTGLKAVDGKLGDFIRRIEGIITGEVQTTAAQQGRELVADYQRWRESVENRLDDAGEFQAQGKLLGRLAAILVGGNLLAIVAAIYAVVQVR